MQDRIKQMAVEVGLLEPRDEWATVPADYRAALVSFARLVAEDCARVCEDDANDWDKHAEQKDIGLDDKYMSMARSESLKESADAIRARYAEKKEG